MAQHPPHSQRGDHHGLGPSPTNDGDPDPAPDAAVPHSPADKADASTALGPANKQRVYDSGQLLAGQGEALIRHGHDIYRLRATARGGLILIK